ncbi:MAG: hypothetical protein WCJ45_02185 [bacterium]
MAPDTTTPVSEFSVSQWTSRTCQKYGGTFDSSGPSCRFTDGTICSGEKVADWKCMLMDGTLCKGTNYVQNACTLP